MRKRTSFSASAYRALFAAGTLSVAAFACGDMPEVEGRGATSEALDGVIPVDPEGLVNYTEIRQICRERHPLRKAFFGELHLHTSFSFDAFAGGTRNDPAGAFDFARGAPLTVQYGPTPKTTQLQRPLDFAGITDHAEFMGVFDLCTEAGSASYDTPACRDYRGGLVSLAEEDDELDGVDPSHYGFYRSVVSDAWHRTQEAAENAYDTSPDCTFTAFKSFEYTATPGGNMNHRNVIFRNDTVPALPVGFLAERTPEDLWDRLDNDCVFAGTGCEVLAIPHNSNFSGGLMFDVEYGGAVTLAAQTAVARQRARLEPLVEIYQHKGASECSPNFSNDEQCAFEYVKQDLCDPNASGLSAVLTGCDTPQSFVRGALAIGLAEKERLGVNPFQLGIIASTDSHNGNPGDVEEDDWIGSVGIADTNLVRSDPEFGPGGLVGVWSVENSRDALFEAMQRRETFGTSGPRIEVRLFAGWDYPSDMCGRADLTAQGYRNGVPMGQTVASAAGRPLVDRRRGPTFVLQAVNDGTLLQVAQIVKLWVHPVTGELMERVFDVGGDAGNGASVDLATCVESGPGAQELCSEWTDPTFNPNRAAVYYARVLENPSCRWIQHECNRSATPNAPLCTDGSVPKTTQERAWTSPIWYEPT